MTTPSSRGIVVFGSGPGIGISVASRFASQGFDHVILLSRNAQRLAEEKQAVLAGARTEGLRVDAVPVDLADPTSLSHAFQQIDRLTQSVEVVFYNAARVAPSPLLEFPVEGIEYDFKVRDDIHASMFNFG